MVVDHPIQIIDGGRVTGPVGSHSKTTHVQPSAITKSMVVKEHGHRHQQPLQSMHEAGMQRTGIQTSSTITNHASGAGMQGTGTETSTTTTGHTSGVGMSVSWMSIRPGMLLMQVPLNEVARDLPPRLLSEQTLLQCLRSPHAHLHTLIFLCTLKMPSTGSPATVWTHEKYGTH